MTIKQERKAREKTIHLLEKRMQGAGQKGREILPEASETA
jgi:hypothetical protein